ncbi:MAG: lipase maturation factor family protein [Nitrospinota bacterium]|nr:lipase maturation factor family protein [Nitrospinota bacterium]
MPTRPIMIYDGDCTFCRYWVSRWSSATRGRVEYAPSQEVGKHFPQIPPEIFQTSVQLVETDGKVYEGAEGVFRALAQAPGKRWTLWLYEKLPGFSSLTETIYRQVAEHRHQFGLVSRWIWGTEYVEPEYFLLRRLFLICIGIIYFIAFLSLWQQVVGLIGSRGIVPLEETLKAYELRFGAERFQVMPSVFWLGSSDGFLEGLCLAGMGLSLLVLAGISPVPALVLLWFFYLSFLGGGNVFMAFQWDTLLLETGFLAIFLAPGGIRPRLSSEAKPSTLILFLYRLLLFKVIFSSGMVKLLSGDESWRNLTALMFHYETQPLTTWVGWYAHQLPGWFQKFSVLGVFAIQLLVPFLIFAPGRLKWLACFLLSFLQILIMLTGNYCFFNLLTLALCLFLLDDATFKKLMPWFAEISATGVGRKRESQFKQFLVSAVAVIIIFITFTIQLLPLAIRDIDYPDPVLSLYEEVRPFRSVNNYGLFAVMTTSRPEIILEGSDDFKTWKEYAFKWKPGDLNRAPGFVAPHQPRLDWQMWFAVLSSYERNPWFLRFMVRVLQGSEAVISLLDHNPFPDKPPRYLRAVVYEYRFTDFTEKKATGNWWKREPKGMYAPVLNLPAGLRPEGTS